MILMADNAKNRKRNIINLFLNANFNVLVVFVVIIFMAAVYFFIIKPKFDLTLVAIKDSITQQEQFYQNQRQKLIDLQAAAALYHKISDADIGRINAVLPNVYAKEKLFGELEDLIMQQGLLVTGISLAKVGEEENGGDEPMAAKEDRVLDIPNADKIGVIQATINLASVDYAALKNLLPILESHLQLIDIKSISFDQEEKTAELVVYTYYFK